MEDEALQKKKLEEEVIILRSQLLQLTLEAEQVIGYVENHCLVIVLGLPFAKFMRQWHHN